MTDRRAQCMSRDVLGVCTHAAAMVSVMPAHICKLRERNWSERVRAGNKASLLKERSHFSRDDYFNFFAFFFSCFAASASETSAASFRFLSLDFLPVGALSSPALILEERFSSTVVADAACFFTWPKSSGGGATFLRKNKNQRLNLMHAGNEKRHLTSILQLKD